MAEMAMRNLKLLALSDEAPNRLSVRLEVTGLPHAPTLVKAFGALKSERDAARRRARQDLPAGGEHRRARHCSRGTGRGRALIADLRFIDDAREGWIRAQKTDPSFPLALRERT